MRIFIRNSSGTQPIPTFELKFADGHSLEIHYDECIRLVKQTNVGLWYKICLINSIVLNCENNIIEWSLEAVGLNPAETTKIDGYLNISNKKELEVCFDEINQTLKRKNIVIEDVVNQLVNFMPTYILPIITFRNSHIDVFQEILGQQSHLITKLQYQIHQCEILLKKNITFNKTWLSEFNEKKSFNHHNKDFLEELCNNIELMINDVREEIEFYHKEIDISLDDKNNESFEKYRDLREKAYINISDFLKIKCIIWQRHKQIRQEKIRTASFSEDFTEEMNKYKQNSFNVFEARKNLKSAQDNFENANEIKENLNAFLLEMLACKEELNSIKTIIRQSMSELSSFGFIDSIVEEINAIFLNTAFPIFKKSREFCQIFANACLCIQEKNKQSDYVFIVPNSRVIVNDSASESGKKSPTIESNTSESLVNSLKLNNHDLKKDEDENKAIVNSSVWYDNQDNIIWLQKLKTFLNQHFNMMWLDIQSYATIDTQPFNINCFWVSYEMILNPPIYPILIKMYETLYSKECEILRSFLNNIDYSDLNITNATYQPYCSQVNGHNHEIGLKSKDCRNGLICSDFQKYFDKVFIIIDQIVIQTSLIKSAEGFNNIKHTIAKLASEVTVDNLIQIIKLIFLHCSVDLNIKILIALKVIHDFLPMFFRKVNFGHSLLTFCSLYETFLSKGDVGEFFADNEPDSY